MRRGACLRKEDARMKGKWKNNIVFKIVAVVFAAFLWWTVANVDDPVIARKFKTSVTVTHSEVITNIGKSFQVVDDTKNITVTVKARRSVVERIRSTHIKATADAREMQDSAIPVRITIDGFEGMYVEASANPQNIQVITEDTEKKTFPITAVTTGNVREGYVLGTITAKPQTIDISGPKSLIGRISKVVAKVDVSELSENANLRAQVIYYDAADNIIDQSQLSSNCDKKGVRVEIELFETKTVALQFDDSQITVAPGFSFKGITVEPEQVEVYGSISALKDLEIIEIDGKALKQENLRKNKEVVIDITKYLPKGVELSDGNSGSVVVFINVEKSGTKSILLPVRSVQVDNMPSDMELFYGPEQEIELQFQGTKANLEKLTIGNIIAAIDLADYKEEGTYDVPVQIIDMPEGCVYTGKITVQVILSKRQEE